jgi:hypothetical protein
LDQREKHLVDDFSEDPLGRGTRVRKHSWPNRSVGSTAILRLIIRQKWWVVEVHALR